MFNHKLGVAASIAAGMFITFSGMTATAQTTTTSQSGTSGSSQQTSTGSQSGSTGQSSSQTGGTQSGTSSQQSGTMNQGSQSTSQSAAGAAGSTISNDDRKFMIAAAEGGMGEVEMARVALEKASSESVKKYAQQMIDDHTKANDELKQIAAQKGVTLPPAPDAKRQAVLTRLQQLSGAEFDRAYIKEAGNKDHDKQAKLFQKQADRGKDAEVKAFAVKTLPTVKMHLEMARGMSGQMSGDSMNTSGSTGGNMSGGSTNRSSDSTNQSGGSTNQGSGSGSTNRSGGSTTQGSGSGNQSTTTPSTTTPSTTTPSTTTPSTTTPSTTTPKR